MAEEDQHNRLTLAAVACYAIYRNITSFLKFNEGILWKEVFRRFVWTLRNSGTHFLKASWSPSTVICFKELTKVSFKGTNNHDVSPTKARVRWLTLSFVFGALSTNGTSTSFRCKLIFCTINISISKDN